MGGRHCAVSWGEWGARDVRRGGGSVGGGRHRGGWIGSPPPMLTTPPTSAGTLHGLVQSVGRFLTLRAAISAVVDEASFERRLFLGFTVFVVVGLENWVFLLAKHMLVSHLSTYLGGRASTLLISKISRVGERPAGTSESTL